MEKDNLSILVIDPETTDHHLIQNSLFRSKVPAQLHFVSTTEEGLKKANRENLDLILTDHQLPRANAFQLLFEIQQVHPNLPIILLTREDEARIAREAFQRGVDDYILKEELETISLFDIIGNTIEKRRKKEEVVEQTLKLRELAERDGLTGLYNHRFLIDAVEREFARARRYHRPLSILIIDMDGFKIINDTCGHAQGDKVLKQVAHILLQTVRFVDVAARYGGDEFVVVLPETNLKDGARLGERILKEIFPLSASIGVACFNSGQDSAGALLKEADQALYQAKKGGRSRVVTSAHSPLTKLRAI